MVIGWILRLQANILKGRSSQMQTSSITLVEKKKTKHTLITAIAEGKGPGYKPKYL